VTDCQFEFGSTSAYGSKAPCAQGAGAGNAQVAVSAPLASLSAQRTYHFRIVATTPGGTAQGADRTFTTATTATLGPRLSGLRLKPKAFHAQRKGHRHRAPTGTTISYMDSQPAVTTFTILQARRGVRSHGRCVAPPRHRHGKSKLRRCTRSVSRGGFSHRDRRSGIERLRFDGRIHGRPLAAGGYTLTAVATDSVHHRSNTVRVGFHITP
jgi:hypothetical protein